MYHSWRGINYIEYLVRSDLLDVCRATKADRKSRIKNIIHKWSAATSKLRKFPAFAR